VFATAGVAELQSLVTMEAMATGRPVVAADAVALPHLVQQGENGFRFAPGDAAAAGKHLRALLTDDVLRAEMGEGSRSLIARHSLEASLERFEELYLQVAQQKMAGERGFATVTPGPEGTAPVPGLLEGRATAGSPFRVGWGRILRPQ
jgi:hypothetical protein